VSIFSRFAKNIKRGLRSLAPIVAPILGIALPGLGGQIGSVLLGGIGGGRTPGIAPPAVTRVRPGAGLRPTFPIQLDNRTRRTPSQALRKPVITPGPVRQQMSLFGAVPVIARAAPIIGRGVQAVGRFIGSPTGRITIGGTAAAELARTFVGGGGAGACPSGSHLNKQDGVGGPAGTYCVRNRRMNFGNARAARRGVRRLKGARKLLKDIEKMMPRAPARRKAVEHHHHPRGGVV